MTSKETPPLSPEAARDIQAVARHIESHVNENWHVLLEKNDAKLQDAYQRAGDMAYGTYLDLVFRPIHKQLRQAGLKPKPRLPGKFDISREWGNADETISSAGCGAPCKPLVAKPWAPSSLSPITTTPGFTCRARPASSASRRWARRP